MTIATYVTIIRLIISPIFLMIYLLHESLGIDKTLLPYVLLSLFVLSELSDACDGFLARRYNQVTDLGKILDPMADSIYRISVFLAFTHPPVNLSIIPVYIFIYRDSLISTLRTICALKGFTLAARTSGKMKAVVQASSALVILILMVPASRGELSLEGLHWSASVIAWIAAGYTILSGIEYIVANRHHIAKVI